jgi:sulfite reductase (NADPH) flavoprotein alpha-component
VPVVQGGGHVYVCGDGANMAADVHKALLEIAVDIGKVGSEAEAEFFFEKLVKQHRYQRDVWVT